MNKLLIVFGLVFFSANILAEDCTAIIQDRIGNTLERHTYSGYSRASACSEAMFQCNRALSDAQSSGRYYDANCLVEDIYNPNPPTQNIMCQTDLVDIYSRILRTFSGYGRSEYEACSESERFCNEELYRNNTYGMRCLTRRGNPNPPPYPPNPPRNKTESCQAQRYDPAGMFIQSYSATATGPIYSDVKGQACNTALNFCQREIRGRQYCNISR